MTTAANESFRQSLRQSWIGPIFLGWAFFRTAEGLVAMVRDCLRFFQPTLMSLIVGGWPPDSSSLSGYMGRLRLTEAVNHGVWTLLIFVFTFLLATWLYPSHGKSRLLREG